LGKVRVLTFVESVVESGKREGRPRPGHALREDGSAEAGERR